MGVGGQRSVWSCVVVFFFSLVGGFEFSSLCLQLEAHADFVSTGIEVFPVDEG